MTIRDVAEDAGVSVAAVSKVLRDAYGVSDALRAKVKASIDRLSYRPHAAARGMRGQTYTLGFLIPDLHNPFFADIHAGVNTALERTQYQLLMGVSDSDPNSETALMEAMMDRRMDGVILIGSRIAAEQLAEVASRIPVVVIAFHPQGETNFDTVNNDDRLGATLVVQHLVGAGYENIAFLSQQISVNEQTMVT
ncbi:MAG TPA: LacI family DNA-binding transcriptional regulator, partial [Devosia sp.]|nr:LacI family DNA-binding transcriptional regulator [Devosia sp.]